MNWSLLDKLSEHAQERVCLMRVIQNLAPKIIIWNSHALYLDWYINELHRCGTKRTWPISTVMPDRGRRIHRPPAFDAAGTLVGGSGLTRAGFADRIKLSITMISAHKLNNYLIMTRVSSLTYTPCGVSVGKCWVGASPTSQCKCLHSIMHTYKV